MLFSDFSSKIIVTRNNKKILEGDLMQRSIKETLTQRTDISQYLVHLTKDTDDGKSAKENLISILKGGQIEARKHHCLFSPKLRKEDEEIQKLFNVVCLTETPLEKIHLLTNIKGRKINLRPFGVVFTKEAVINKQGNPAMYVYGANKILIKFMKQMYREFIEAANEDPDEIGDFDRLGSLVNIVKTGHDFHWEREWRVKEKLVFQLSDIYAVIAPETDHKSIRNAVDIDVMKYVLFIDPRWNMEQLVDNMSCYIWNEMMP
jgi:hypothetical protein